MASLNDILQKHTSKRGISGLLTENEHYTAVARGYEEAKAREEAEQNNGGFFAGLGYTLAKFGVGAFSVLEGIWDFTAGGIADLFGADEWAEEQFANNIAGGWSAGLDDWYNPSDGWRMAGDIASGVGNSLVGIGVAAGVTLITGGAAAPAAGWIAAGTMGLGAAGNATSEAYAKTGELGFKEYGYGLLSGGTEMALEKLTGGASKVAGKLFAKETAKTVAKKSIVKGILSDFAGEAFEEGMSEFLTPYYQRWTQVDPDAKNATAQEIGYAALVGGLSGTLLGGFGAGASTLRTLNRGNNISKDAKTTEGVVNMAREFATHENEKATGDPVFQTIAQLVEEYDAIKPVDGKITLKQKKLLGEMERANIVATFAEPVKRSKANIIANADEFVKVINERKIPDATTGKPIHFASGAELVNNENMLTQFAVMDTLGKLMLSADSVYDLVSSKRADGIMQADFRVFQKDGKMEHKKAINELFGIDVDSITYEDFVNKIQTTNQNVFNDKKDVLQARATSKKVVANAMNAGADIGTFDKGLQMQDGTQAFKAKDGKVYAVTKRGDDYYLYLDGKISTKLTKAKLISAINELNGVQPKPNNKPNTKPTGQNNAQNTAESTTATTNPTGEETTQKPKKKKPKKVTRTTENTTAEPTNTETTDNTNAKNKKKTEIARMRKSEDTTERVLAELYANGAADYDAVSTMKDGQDLADVDKVAFFATGTAKDYVRQGLYSEKSLATAIKEFAGDIKAGKDVLVQVMDRAIELSGKQQPTWYKEQYHKETAQTTENTATTPKKASKKPSTEKARENLLKFVLRKDNERVALRGAFTINGKQYLSDGYFAVAYDDAMELTQAQGEPMAILEKIIEVHRTTDAARSVNVDMDAIRENYPPRGAESMEYLAKLGDSYYQTQLVRKVAETLKNPTFYVVNKAQNGINAPFTQGMLYIKADNGEAVILPIRTQGGNNKLSSKVVRYTADFVSKASSEIKKTTKPEQTETENTKPEKEKTIRGKTYKDFTVEEFKALSAPLRGYYLVKDKKPNAIVLAQVGDFYEAFFNDAQTVANEFDLTLTGRAVKGYTERVEMVGFPVAKFDEYKAKLTEKGLDVVKVDTDGRKVIYNAKTDGVKTTQNTEKSTVKKTEDFGEKIGGARKDEWRKRGLRADDIVDMNSRELEKHVKKENVWKRPNWVQAVADGGDRGLLYAQNEIYKSLNTTPYMKGRYKATDVQIQENAKRYAEEIAEIQAMAEKATTAADFAKMGTTWLVEKGYIEVHAGDIRNGITYTDKYYSSPALYGSAYINTLNHLAKRFDGLSETALMEGFGVATEDKLPRGYEIRKTANSFYGSTYETGNYYIVKGRYIVARGFSTLEDAIKFGKEKFGTAATANATKKGKEHYIPPQLTDVHRNGLDYRAGKGAKGEDFLTDFGIKGGEFGNWLSESDRTESLNYAYDAFCDLADAVGIKMTDISLNGTLSIGFGSRGQGLSGAVAHYEPDRKVINLTKMKGAGSLAHEWWHAFEDYISGDTHQSQMTSDFSKLTEKTRKAAFNLVNTINYREATVEEKQLERQKRHERNIRHLEAFLRNYFSAFDSTQTAEQRQEKAKLYHYKRAVTDADVAKFEELKATAQKGVENVYSKFISEEKTIVDEFSALIKDITGRGLFKEERKTLAYYIDAMDKNSDIVLQKHTKFYDDAVAISVTYAKDGGYWDSNCEMLARAFAAYITDKTSGNNDYLSGHSEGSVPTEKGTAYIMPVGEERKRINAAFDELFKAAKEDGLISSATHTKPTTTVKYAVTETADLNSQPAGNKSQKLAPLQMKRAETFARTHIKGYENLTAAEKLEVEWSIASGWRFGASESDIISLAKISAQSSVGIGFAKLTTTTKDGKTVTPDAACYSRSGHLTIYINPDSKRSIEVATLHELTHSLKGTDGYAELQKMAEEYYGKHPDEKAAIDKAYRALYKDESVHYAEEILPDELTAHYIETMLEKRNVLVKLTAEKPTVMQRCIDWLKKRVTALHGKDTNATTEVDRLANKFISTFNLNKGKIKGAQTNAFAIDNSSQNSYNNEAGGTANEQTKRNQNNKNTSTGAETGANDGGNSGRRGISFFNDLQGTRRIFEISRNAETVQRVKDFASMVYAKAENETQDALRWHAEKEDLTLYFAKKAKGAKESFVYDGEIIVLEETATEKQLVDILNAVKPIERKIDENKIAKISTKRWDRFLQWHPDAYVTRIPIQQFLDMTTNDYVEQRQINARSSQISKQLSLLDIQNTAGEFMYLEVNFESGKVTSHEGRHRMTALLNAGNAYADVFVIPTQETNFESKAGVEIAGQFNDSKFKLGLVRAKSKKFAPAIDYTFRREDGSVRYALPAVDSDNNTLSAAQQKYFKDSQVRDADGNLLVVYHGSPNQFTEFSHRFMNTNGNAHGRGFYFTENAEYANGFKKDGGQLLKGYLDIRKPASETEVTIKKSELVKLIKATCEAQAQEFIDEESYDNIDDALLDTWVSNYVNTYDAYSMDSVYRQVAESVFNSCDNDADIFAELTNGGAGTSRVLSLARKVIGYDGIIFDNGDGTHQFITFESNQFKNVDNTDPTGNADIRYALEVKGEDRVLTEKPDDSVGLMDVITGKATKKDLATQVKGNVSAQTEAAKVLLTNAQAALERVAGEMGVNNPTALTNYVRAGKNAAYNAIEVQGGQYSLDGETRLGDSLGKILQPIYKADAKDKTTLKHFELYLLHHHNIDRMAQNKPVFGEDITAADSQAEIAKLDSAYPNFRKIAEKIWKFGDNDLQLRVDSGLITEDFANTLREMYPHYVPTMRAEHATRAGALMGKNRVWVNNAMKKAKGSDATILPIDDMMAAREIQLSTSARINKMLVDMMENGTHDEFQIIASEDADLMATFDNLDNLVTTQENKDKGNYQITFYHDGKKVTAQVSRLVYKGIEAFQPMGDMFDNPLLNMAAKLNSVFKRAVTSWNPFFTFYKNPVRDMQDALLYTRYNHRTYLKNYKRAMSEISTNGKFWQEAKAAGILTASVYDYEKGVTYKQTDFKSRAKGVLQKVESASNAIEMAPRLAEYISAREAGLSVQDALLQAQDVTTNFGRGGIFAKKLNATVMPFLNPAIQGFSKMWRAYTGKDAAQSWINLIIRSIILGIGATALNDLLNDDDEEYQGLSDYIKEQNYVIGLGGGEFLKIPKGRVVSVFGGAFLRGKRYASGEKDAWEGYTDSILSAVTPVDNFTRTIFSPFTDIQTNTAWHGGTIESQKWDNTEPKNRYDETTSSIAIWLGQVFNYSPIKIDYLLEQYGGIVADIALPATSLQAEKGIISQNMLASSTLNSKWSSKFYSSLEDYNYKKTAGDMQAKGVVKYLNNIKGTVSDLYKQKSQIQANTSLSKDEKLTQTKIIQTTINALQQEAVLNTEYIYNELGKYDLSTDEAFEQAYLDCVSVIIGAEYALKTYNKAVYDKATYFNKLGIGYELYYDYYFGLKNITSDKNANGTTVSGSKKAKVIQYTMAQDLSTEQKLILIMSAGYKISDGDIKGMTATQARRLVAQYITKLNLSKAEKAELAQSLGFTIKNGRIYVN